MITLYESILSSTKAGKDKVITPVIDWFLKNITAQSYKLNREDVTAEPIKGEWKIIVNKPELGHMICYFRFTQYNSEDGINLPYKIHSIEVNGKLSDISYTKLDFYKNSDFAKEVRSKINFCNCYIDSITDVPKNCRILSFSHYLGDGPTVVSKIEDIDVNMLQCFHNINNDEYRCGLDINIRKIRNCKIRQTMHIAEGMLKIQGDAIMPNGKDFSPAAQVVLKEFFKNNDVKPENCKFFPYVSKRKSVFGTIEYNKRKDKYIYKPE